MKRNFEIALALILLFYSWTAWADDVPTLDSVFGDQMVLQRDQTIVLRGQAVAGQTVRVGLGEREQSVNADGKGRWQAVLDAMEAGGPHKITLDGRVAARDVLIGDVFLCSGQSNMEHPVRLALNPDREIAASADPEIRLLTVPKGNQTQPTLQFENPASWEIASPETVPEFSAVCYFTARNLKSEIKVPIGLVEASWGGSRIETWMSFEVLEQFPDLQADLALLKAYREDARVGTARFVELWQAWWRDRNPGQAEPWIHLDRYDWTPVPEPLRNWKTWGVPELANYNGQLWFKAEFMVEEGKEFPNRLALGSVDETDLVWINGRFIGTDFGWGTERYYDLPEGAVKTGKNQVLVNIESVWGRGGLFGPEEAIHLSTPSGERLPLRGWEYFQPKNKGLDAPGTPWKSVFGLTVQHNAMLAPLADLPFRGAIWYQGESNWNNPAAYEDLLSTWVDDLQSVLGSPVPVIVIQLPEFGAALDAPGESNWARLRESQRRVAASRQDVAVVVTLGTGDPFDVHPPNKQEVALRAVDAARRLFYDQDVVDTNRDPVAAVKQGNSVLITLSNSERALRTWSADRVFGLELCANSNCRFVSGEVEGATIHIDIPAGFNPDRVRYNWADQPFGNLADASSRPIGTFEIAIE